MALKKATGTATAKKATGATATHPSYQDMIKEAVISLKERNGSSRQAIKKYVQANNNLTGVTDAAFTNQFNKALQRGSESGVFARPKGTSGPVKLATSKTAEAKPKTATTKAPKTKAATTTKASGDKKTATKKTAAAAPKAAKATSTTKKTPAKKATATKSKANTSKVRKAPSAAPAVEEKAPVVLGKPKSGRVTKSNAPQPSKASAPKKKTATTKKSAPKKTAAATAATAEAK